MNPRCVIFVRVSTSEQETARQVSELEAVCASKGWNVIEIIREDGVRGSARNRPQFDKLIGMITCKEIEKVAVHEISRIARKNSVAHHFLESCNANGVSLYWHAQRIETLLDHGKPNPVAGIMFALLSEMARAESEVLGMRVSSGMQEAKRKGVRIGRPVKSIDDFLLENAAVVEALRSGLSIRKVSAATGVNHVTVQKVKKAIQP